MLRTHRYGDQGNLGGQDHLKDHVDEATSKRKGEPEKTPLKTRSDALLSLRLTRSLNISIFL